VSSKHPGKECARFRFKAVFAHIKFNSDRDVACTTMYSGKLSDGKWPGGNSNRFASIYAGQRISVILFCYINSKKIIIILNRIHYIIDSQSSTLIHLVISQKVYLSIEVCLGVQMVVIGRMVASGTPIIDIYLI
jgi:hypothetical protein